MKFFEGCGTELYNADQRKARINPLTCHPTVMDLTNGYGEKRNWYCPTCKAHHWDGRHYTEKEWDIYVNDVSFVKGRK